MKFITEPKKRTPVAEETELIVAGGGIAGVASAVAAARNGAKTLLVERNGLLGGVATAGLMAAIGNKFFVDEKIVVRGIALEILERLVEKGGTSKNWKAPQIGSSKTSLIPKFVYDHEIFSLILLEMVEEADVRLYLNTLVVDTITSEDVLNGVIIESKSGREALLGGVVVDATGDADVAARAGAPFKHQPPSLPGSTLEFRMGNVDLQKTYEYFKKEPDRYPDDKSRPITFKEFERNWLKNGIFYYSHGGGAVPGSNIAVLVEKAIEKGEFSKEMGMIKALDGLGMDGMAWNNTVIINSNFAKIDNLNVRESSKAEAKARRACFYIAEFLKKYVPGFENAFINSTATNFGVKYTRVIEGEHTLTVKDVNSRTKFDDVIGVASTLGQSYFTLGIPYEIPYRCLAPKKVENLLVASGKSAPTSPKPLLRGMPTSIILGQAAGVAASISLKEGTTPRKIDVRMLQKALLRQDVYLGNEERLRKLGLS